MENTVLMMELLKVLTKKNYTYKGENMDLEMDYEIPAEVFNLDEDGIKIHMKCKIENVEIQIVNDEFNR